MRSQAIAKSAMSALAIALALTTLFLMGTGRTLDVASLNPYILVPIWLLLSLAAYQYWEPVRRLRRHAFLSHAAQKDGWLRRRFWKASLLRIPPWIASLITSAIAIILTPHLLLKEWVVILSSLVVFISLVYADRKFKHGISAQIVPKYRLAISLRVATWATVLMFALVMTYVQLQWVEVQSTKHIATLELAKTTWQNTLENAVEPQAWPLAVAATADELRWHLFQIIEVPEERSRSAYLLVVSGISLWNALKIGVVWLILTGLVLACFRDRRVVAADIRSSLLAFGIVLAFLLLAAMLVREVRFYSPPMGGDECAVLWEKERESTSQQAFIALAKREEEFVASLDRPIREFACSIYRRAEDGVDGFLDWHFSIRGQYQQLGYWALSLFGRRDLDAVVAERLGKYIHSAVENGQSGPAMVLDETLAAQVVGLHREHEASLARLFAQSECWTTPPLEIGLGDPLEKSLVGLGAITGPAAARFSSAVAMRTATTGAVRRVAVSVAAKLGARVSSAGSAGAAGLLCPPPFNLVCPVVFAGSVWFATDYGLSYVDATLHREALRAEILRVMTESMGEYEAELRFAVESFVWDMFVDLEEWQAQMFNVLRDGGRP